MTIRELKEMIKQAEEYHKRLVERDKDGIVKPKPCISRTEINDKLCDYEDIEDELGISLITFFKYLFAEKVYRKPYENGDIDEYKVVEIAKDKLIVMDENCPYSECWESLYFKDYGKTWWLEKPEEK